MELKTKVHAEDGRHDLFITRDFDLPIELLFKAYAEAEFVEQWMNTKVLKLEGKKHGSWQIETSNPQGQVAFRAGGVFHEFIPDQKIIRTFEMENSPFGVQLEVHDFQRVSHSTSKLTIHTIYETIGQRDQMLKLPFKQGINMAHNRMEEILSKLK